MATTEANFSSTDYFTQQPHPTCHLFVFSLADIFLQLMPMKAAFPSANALEWPFAFCDDSSLSQLLEHEEYGEGNAYCSLIPFLL